MFPKADHLLCGLEDYTDWGKLKTKKNIITPPQKPPKYRSENSGADLKSGPDRVLPKPNNPS